MYKKGDWKAICDSCGFEFYASELKERWDGMRVCKEDYETRHPLDFIRAKEDKPNIIWTRPNDSASAVTIYTNNQSLAVTLSGTLMFYFDTTSGAITVTLPAANNSSFKGISVNYIIVNYSGSNNLSITSSSAIQGSSTVSSGTTGRYRNVPTNNLWIRES